MAGTSVWLVSRIMLRTCQAQASFVKKLGGKVKVLFSGLLLEIATERF